MLQRTMPSAEPWRAKRPEWLQPTTVAGADGMASPAQRGALSPKLHRQTAPWARQATQARNDSGLSGQGPTHVTACASPSCCQAALPTARAAGAHALLLTRLRQPPGTVTSKARVGKSTRHELQMRKGERGVESPHDPGKLHC